MNSNHHVTHSSNNFIPKNIHQIWLGSFDPPHIWMNTWKKFCSLYNWKYYFWNEKSLNDFKLVNQTQFNDASSYQEKADIARYEVVYRLGGLYVDCDMVWLGHDLDRYIPFNKNHFIGVQEPYSRFLSIIGSPYLSNGFFAASKGCVILLRCISEIPERYKINSTNPVILTGPTLLNKCIKNDIISIIPSKLIFPLDFHIETNTTDPMIFSDRSLVFTYNGNEYPHLKKLTWMTSPLYKLKRLLSL